MNYTITVQRAEKAGSYLLPSTIKTYRGDSSEEHDRLVRELRARYKDRKDIRISEGCYRFQDWDDAAIMEGYLYPGQYTMHACWEHGDEGMCWHVYDPMRKDKEEEEYCIASHVSYQEACRLTNTEYPDEAEDRKGEGS